MIKNFDSWNTLKKEINDNKSLHQFREREVWWMSIGVNIGFEQDGKYEQFHRPVLVLKKFSKDMFFGIPLTSKSREDIYYSKFKYLKKDKQTLRLPCSHKLNYLAPKDSLEEL